MNFINSFLKMRIIERKVYTNTKYMTSKLNEVTYTNKYKTKTICSLKGTLKKRKNVIDPLKIRKWPLL